MKNLFHYFYRILLSYFYNYFTAISGSDSFYQQRSFSMLSSLCDHQLDRYDWFVRAMDDTYLNVENLMKMIKRQNPKKMVFYTYVTCQHR